VEIDTEAVDGAVPDAGDTLNQDALAVPVQASVPLPLFEIWIDCAEGAAPPAIYANCRLAGAAAMVEGEGAAAMIAMASVPGKACTVIVIRPVKVAGRTALIAVFVHEVTCKICPVVEPAGVAITLQPLHDPLKSSPVIVIVEPEFTISGSRLTSGPMPIVLIFGPILQRTAEE
jgi:hypothetical protein